MKTGFSEDTRVDDTTVNLIASLTLFTEDAINIACIYSSHHNNSLVNGKCMVTSMKTRFKHKDHYDSQTGTLERLMDIKKELLNDEESEDESDDEESDEEMETDDNISFGCICQVCISYQDTLENWDSWIGDNLDQFSPINVHLLNAIKKAEESI
jgi:hypothetical protein